MDVVNLTMVLILNSFSPPPPVPHHHTLRKRSFRSLSELKDAVLDQYSVWGSKFGVLLFLYSVLLTKVCLRFFWLLLVRV